MTDDTEDQLRWSFGGGDRPVLSWPVMDEAGNVFVLVGIDAVVDPEVVGPLDDHLLRGHYRMSRIDLVSLAPDGALRWQTPVATPQFIVSRELRWRPVVGPDGDVWVCFTEAVPGGADEYERGDLSRFSNAGELLWTASEACLSEPLAFQSSMRIRSPAIASDGTAYLTAFVSTAESNWFQELRAIGPDGVERWRRTIGVESDNCCTLEGGGVWGTEVSGPMVLPDRSVVSGCDMCEPGMGGLARFDAATGSATMLWEFEAERTFYDLKLWDGDEVEVFVSVEGGSLTNGTWGVTVAGEAVEIESAELVSAAGPIFHPEIADGGITLRWGMDTFTIAPDALAKEWVPGAAISAAVKPDALLLTLLPWEGGFPCTKDCELALVDRQGEVLWQRDGVFGGTVIPVIGDGFIAYIEDEGQRLVAVNAPVTGIADGPWPIVGGNSQGNPSGE